MADYSTNTKVQDYVNNLRKKERNLKGFRDSYMTEVRDEQTPSYNKAVQNPTPAKMDTSSYVPTHLKSEPRIVPEHQKPKTSERMSWARNAEASARKLMGGK